MSIPSNITREHIERAIEKIDKEGIPPRANSSTYDVFFREKKYPPKLIVSYANEYANGEILNREEFHGGPDYPAFKLLHRRGFKILTKNGVPVVFDEEKFYPQLQKFLEQSETGNLKTKHFKDSFKGLKVKVSFGQGVSAQIPWISFLIPPHTTSEGIYPGYLFYKDINRLILFYGISETKIPTMN